MAFNVIFGEMKPKQLAALKKSHVGWFYKKNNSLTN
jgi:hypothetical protein